MAQSDQKELEYAAALSRGLDDELTRAGLSVGSGRLNGAFSGALYLSGGMLGVLLGRIFDENKIPVRVQSVALETNEGFGRYRVEAAVLKAEAVRLISSLPAKAAVNLMIKADRVPLTAEFCLMTDRSGKFLPVSDKPRVTVGNKNEQESETLIGAIARAAGKPFSPTTLRDGLNGALTRVNALAVSTHLSWHDFGGELGRADVLAVFPKTKSTGADK